MPSNLFRLRFPDLATAIGRRGRYGWRRISLSRFSLAVAPALLALPAHGMGLGAPSISPILGQPLRLEIPLSIHANEPPLTSDCIRIVPPAEAPDRQFFPADARIVVDMAHRPRILIVSPTRVNSPLVEFRLTIGCHGNFSKDFLVLTRLPDTQTSAAAEPASAKESTRPPSRSASVSSAPTFTSPGSPSLGDTATEAGETLTIDQDTNLNVLARQRYPNRPDLRNEYRRLIAQANPALFPGRSRFGSVPLPAGTVLNIPSGLPSLEGETSFSPKFETDPIPPPPRPAPARTTKSDIAAAKSSASRDRLVIGGNGEGGSSAMRDLATSLDRLERMIEDQGRTELNMVEDLKTLDAAFIEAKNYIVALEAKTRQLEAGQRQMQARMQADETRNDKSVGLYELLAVVLGSGVLGAGLLSLNHRLQLRRQLLVQALDLPKAPHSDTHEPILPSSPAMPKAPEHYDSALHGISTPPPFADKSPPHPELATQLARVRIRESAAALAAKNSPSVSQEAPPTRPPSPISPPKNDDDEEIDYGRDQWLPPVANPENNAKINESIIAFELALHGNPKSSSPLSVAAKNTPPSASIIEVTPGQTMGISNVLAAAKSSESHEDPAIELADIMTSMGLTSEASVTLVDYIFQDPKRDLAPWLKALEIYRSSGQREEFEWLASTLRQHLNVKPDDWDDGPNGQRQSLEDFPHLIDKIQKLWPSKAADDFLLDLLRDHREGTRVGFPQAVAEDILLLRRVLREFVKA